MDCIWYNGLYTCTPRVGSRQASQNKLIWFTLLCLKQDIFEEQRKPHVH